MDKRLVDALPAPPAVSRLYTDDNIACGRAPPPPPPPADDEEYTQFDVTQTRNQPLIRSLEDIGLKCLAVGDAGARSVDVDDVLWDALQCVCVCVCVFDFFCQTYSPLVSPDVRDHLRKLHRSLVFNFLELVDVLVVSPEQVCCLV